MSESSSRCGTRDRGRSQRIVSARTPCPARSRGSRCCRAGRAGSRACSRAGSAPWTACRRPASLERWPPRARAGPDPGNGRCARASEGSRREDLRGARPVLRSPAWRRSGIASRRSCRSSRARRRAVSSKDRGALRRRASAGSRGGARPRPARSPGPPPRRREPSGKPQALEETPRRPRPSALTSIIGHEICCNSGGRKHMSRRSVPRDTAKALVPVLIPLVTKVVLPIAIESLRRRKFDPDTTWTRLARAWARDSRRAAPSSTTSRTRSSSADRRSMTRPASRGRSFSRFWRTRAPRWPKS